MLLRDDRVDALGFLLREVGAQQGVHLVFVLARGDGSARDVVRGGVGLPVELLSHRSARCSGVSFAGRLATSNSVGLKWNSR